MDILDIFLNKYSYKFPKGYPDMNNEQDVLLMEGLLSELGINEEEDKNLTFEQCKYILSKDVKLKDKYIKEIETIYDANPNNQKSFLDNFRKHSINDLDFILNIYKDYINITEKGLGRGEVFVLLGVKDSVSGGNTKKDIKIKEETYDVKELSNNTFRPASSGYITNSTFQKHYVYLMSLLSVINKDNNKDNNKAEQIDKKEKKDKTETIQDLVSKLIIYYDDKYKTGNISKGILDNIRKDLLPKIKLYTKTEGDIEEKPYIKIGDKKYEIDKVVYTDGKPESVKLGLAVEEQKSLIAKLLKHPWVKNPEKLDEDLNKIWLGYLKTVNGLIIYDDNKFNFYDSSKAVNAFIPYRVAQNQIILIEKGKSPPSDEEIEAQ
jgi:hypothetical protein